MKKIGITGVNGFIGSHLADYCRSQGHDVWGLERTKYVINPFIKQLVGDIRDPEVVNYFVGMCDGVVNLAGLLGTSEQVSTPQDSIDANIKGAINFYEAVRRHEKPAVQITVGNHTWNNTYAITKSCAERFALMYNKEHGTEIAVVRGLNVYGPRQKHKPVKKVVPNFIRSAMNGEDIVIYGDGEQLLDLIYVDDTVKILYDALVHNHGVYDHVIEAGSGEVVTANYLARQVKVFSASISEIKHIPMRSGEPDKSVTKADINTLLPLGKYEFTPLQIGLKKTVAWYMNHREALDL